MSIAFQDPEGWQRDLSDLRTRLLWAIVFLLAVTALGTVGFKILEPSAGWIEAFYMTAITLTTVGYSEEIPIDRDVARIFTAVLILFGMGGVLYFVSSGTAFLLEGQLGHAFRRRRMTREIEATRDHLIVCGSGKTAQYAAREFAAIGRRVVLVAEEGLEGGKLAKSTLSDVPVLVGDPTEDSVLTSAGIERAAGVLACSASDNENVVITLTARHLNPDVRIVSRVMDVDNEPKIRKAGADAVVSPQFTGGLRMASELVRPAAVSFLDTMIRDRELNLRIDEIRVSEGSPSAGRALNEIGLDEVPRALLLATRSPDGDWEYNPLRSRIVEEGTVLIFLASAEDARELCTRLGAEMIAAPAAPV